MMLMGYSTYVQQKNWCAAKQCRNNCMKPPMQAILRNHYSVIKPFVLRPKSPKKRIIDVFFSPEFWTTYVCFAFLPSSSCWHWKVICLMSTIRKRNITFCKMVDRHGRCVCCRKTEVFINYEISYYRVNNTRLTSFYNDIFHIPPCHLAMVIIFKWGFWIMCILQGVLPPLSQNFHLLCW